MIGFAYLSRDEQLDPRTKAGDVLLDDQSAYSIITGLPHLVSVAPKSAIVGKEFRYFLKVVDSDTPNDQLSVTVISAPTWMQFDDTQLVLSGIPAFGQSDTQRVVLSISDGNNVVQESFYLLILENSEEVDQL